MDEYTRVALKQAQEAGKSAAEIAALAKEMDGFKALYANPISRMAVTATEISPVAILMPIISAALLRNSRFMPAKAAMA